MGLFRFVGWRMNMLVTSQYQPRLSSITIFHQADQPMELQYSHQIKLLDNIQGHRKT
jgi:hypothetical protein